MSWFGARRNPGATPLPSKDVCISGQPALDPEAGVYRPGTVEEEFRQAFANVRNSARAAGFSLAEFVSVHVALAESDDYEIVNRAYRHAFAGSPNLPARLTIRQARCRSGAKWRFKQSRRIPDANGSGAPSKSLIEGERQAGAPPRLLA
jgi:enamine deaminase RidA (YjgF/YER057c/UK114 family)